MRSKRAKCGNCKTGKYTYELDSKETMCPHIGCYKKKRCNFYVPLDNKKPCLIKRLFNSVFSTPPRKNKRFLGIIRTLRSFSECMIHKMILEMSYAL